MNTMTLQEEYKSIQDKLTTPTEMTVFERRRLIQRQREIENELNSDCDGDECISCGS